MRSSARHSHYQEWNQRRELSQALPLPRMESLMPPCYSPRNSTDSKAKIDPSPLHIICGIFCHTQLGVHSMLALIHFLMITQSLTLMIATIVSSHDQRLPDTLLLLLRRKVLIIIPILGSETKISRKSTTPSAIFLLPLCFANFWLVILGSGVYPT